MPSRKGSAAPTESREREQYRWQGGITIWFARNPLRSRRTSPAVLLHTLQGTGNGEHPTIYAAYRSEHVNCMRRWSPPSDARLDHELGTAILVDRCRVRRLYQADCWSHQSLPDRDAKSSDSSDALLPSTIGGHQGAERFPIQQEGHGKYRHSPTPFYYCQPTDVQLTVLKSPRGTLALVPLTRRTKSPPETSRNLVEPACTAIHTHSGHIAMTTSHTPASEAGEHSLHLKGMRHVQPERSKARRHGVERDSSEPARSKPKGRSP
ncbi:hypothetical protein EJ03DRAFT_118568 [Teratosphaeria nubilosa]|uniref:Uncharacterized protein n=1 Tax=Teratosphaeria nubilosa TaxID=161662 RepID=A0A6G1L833_9PEZI|nr:hypothetical protein EJ03DRAFT_118568 [Teratosphaeria nubilosa]